MPQIAPRRCYPRNAAGEGAVARAMGGFLADESGATGAEYALILTIISAALIAVLSNLINAVANGIMTPVNAINSAS